MDVPDIGSKAAEGEGCEEFPSSSGLGSSDEDMLITGAFFTHKVLLLLA